MVCRLMHIHVTPNDPDTSSTQRAFSSTILETCAEVCASRRLPCKSVTLWRAQIKCWRWKAHLREERELWIRQGQRVGQGGTKWNTPMNAKVLFFIIPASLHFQFHSIQDAFSVLQPIVTYCLLGKCLNSVTKNCLKCSSCQWAK